MTKDQIKDMQVKIGVEADGFWGPKSIIACQSHLRKLMPIHTLFLLRRVFLGSTVLMGKMEVTHLCKFVLPFTVYYEESLFTGLSAHEKCAGLFMALYPFEVYLPRRRDEYLEYVYMMVSTIRSDAWWFFLEYAQLGYCY
jgi:hypothetical protein